MSAFRTLCHVALHRGWTTRASKCSAIGYVESKTTFRTFHQMLRLGIHYSPLSISQPLSEILKTFLKNIKYYNLAHMKVVCRGQLIWE